MSERELRTELDIATQRMCKALRRFEEAHEDWMATSIFDEDHHRVVEEKNITMHAYTDAYDVWQKAYVQWRDVSANIQHP